MVNKMRVAVGGLSTLALAGVVGAVSASPAAASSAVVINQAYCVAMVGPYSGALDCAASATGGTQPYTYTWTPQYYPQSQWPAAGSPVVLGCNPGWSWVTLVVRDAAGRTASATAGDFCNTPGGDPL
ncbi:hypothetical protein ACFYMB_01425 [Micromonospora haikouensis]|uniref:hypothetical protein n=1 Tax=Micromonospora haikouensis TaxID=686309 RepID=UPI0034363816